MDIELFRVSSFLVCVRVYCILCTKRVAASLARLTLASYSPHTRLTLASHSPSFAHSLRSPRSPPLQLCLLTSPPRLLLSHLSRFAPAACLRPALTSLASLLLPACCLLILLILLASLAHLARLARLARLLPLASLASSNLAPGAHSSRSPLRCCLAPALLASLALLLASPALLASLTASPAARFLTCWLCSPASLALPASPLQHFTRGRHRKVR